VRSSFLSRVLACAVAALVALPALASPARAQGKPAAQGQPAGASSTAVSDEEARQLFEEGRLAYQNARYDLALDYFMRAYALSRRPALLNNIGAAADRLRKDQQALDAYERYLVEIPDAENRPAIENRIAALKVALAEAAKPTPVPTPAETAAAAPPPAASAPQQATTAPRDSGSDGSVLTSWWLWAGVGVAAIAGVIVGVAASSKTESVVGEPPVVDRGTRVIEL
jgi:tetratricopeptide (TPR) repeat protein